MRFSAILWGLTSAVLGCGALESAARPKTLRVCADPDYLPYSNRAGQGFENKIAQAVAKALGTTVEYTWAPSRRHGGFSEFLSSTLDAKKCDVVMNIPYGSREELTTRPYYKKNSFPLLPRPAPIGSPFTRKLAYISITPFTSLRHTGVSPEWLSTRQLQSIRSTKFFTSFTMYSS